MSRVTCTVSEQGRFLIFGHFCGEMTSAVPSSTVLRVTTSMTRRFDRLVLKSGQLYARRRIPADVSQA
jgi:hypothetical protein